MSAVLAGALAFLVLCGLGAFWSWALPIIEQGRQPTMRLKFTGKDRDGHMCKGRKNTTPKDYAEDLRCAGFQWAEIKDVDSGLLVAKLYQRAGRAVVDAAR